MTNVLEDMKAVYFNGVWDLTSYHSKKILIEKENRYIFETYVTLRKDGESIIVKDDPYNILLKFPDKDSEFWSCDLVQLTESCIYILIHNGFEWNFGEINIKTGEVAFYGINMLGYLNKGTRLCSLYDKEALDHLPEDVVNKLKGEV